MKYAVLSIPGLPNGYKPLNSHFYHNPYPFMKVLEGLYGERAHYEECIWPKEVRHPISNHLKRIPWLSIFIYYWSYQYLKNYQQQIVRKAGRYLEFCFNEADTVFVITHSHGNKVFIDLMREYEPPKGKKLVWLSQAPAYKGVIYGLISPAVGDDVVKKVIAKTEKTLAFRMDTDCLSGDPGVCELHSFRPHLHELFFLAHASVRSRKDVLEDLKQSLEGLTLDQ